MSRSYLITGIAVALAVGVVALFFIFNNPLAMDPFSSQPNVPGTTGTNNGQQATSLVVQDEVVGTGAEAKAGDMITVNYTGKLDNGTVFDTSVGKAPFQFTLGSGQVIPGWDQGLMGMKVGGKRLLIIPPSLAYGSQTYGPIPGNSTLIFEVELVKVTPTQ